MICHKLLKVKIAVAGEFYIFDTVADIPPVLGTAKHLGIATTVTGVAGKPFQPWHGCEFYLASFAPLADVRNRLHTHHIHVLGGF